MWNKIGEWLDYPQDLCELFKVLGMYIFGAALIVALWFGILLPYAAIFDFIIIENSSYVLPILFLISFLLLTLHHYLLKDLTNWYPRLLDKLPDCPKIKWNKGEQN